MKCAVSRVRRGAESIVYCVMAALILVTPSPAQLPETVPVPTPRPDRSPAERPASEPKSGEIAVPLPRPSQNQAGAAVPSGKLAGTAPMPTEELACRARLRELDVRFEERERLSSESGCLVEHPIAVTRLSGTVELEPEAVLNCATAQAAAEFVADVIAPSANASFGSPLVGIRHGSAFVCRERHSQVKMSEHAFGNALDLSTFELANGEVIEVRAYGPAERDRRNFLRKVRGAACGPFKTVLGPGTDAHHAHHLHVDLAQRRSGGTYCK